MSPTDAPPGLDAACDADDDAFVRRVNLLEILAEDSPETAPPPEEAARTWTEARIREHYRTIGANGGSRDEVRDRVRTEPEVESLRDPSGKATTTDDETLPRREQTETTSAPAGSRRRPRVRSNRSRFPEPDEVTFRRWFPGFERANAPMAEASDETAFSGPFKTSVPKARVLCWPNAGNAEDVFTSERARVDGAVRTIPSPLLSWCQTNRTELFAVQLPGRAARSREPPLKCAREAARALMPIVARRFFLPAKKRREETEDDEKTTAKRTLALRSDDDDDDETEDGLIPWIVVGHSVGSWCAFEFVRLAASLGFHAPALACLSGFPAPDIPLELRPWRVNESLDDAAFKEECRAWGMDEAAFGENAWRVFEPLLRADFTLFDEYEYEYEYDESDGRGVENENETFFPRLLTLRGTRDERITREAVSAWRRFSFVDKTKEKNETVSYRHVELIDAPHLLLTQPAFKSAWLRAVADALDAVVR